MSKCFELRYKIMLWLIDIHTGMPVSKFTCATEKKFSLKLACRKLPSITLCHKRQWIFKTKEKLLSLLFILFANANVENDYFTILYKEMFETTYMVILSRAFVNFRFSHTMKIYDTCGIFKLGLISTRFLHCCLNW